MDLGFLPELGLLLLVVVALALPLVRRRLRGRSVPVALLPPAPPSELEAPPALLPPPAAEAEPPREVPPVEPEAPEPAAPVVCALARRAPTRHPVVLAHGFGGWGAVGIKQLAYFRGVSERLHASGVEVHVLRVSPLASIPARARQLAAQIERLGAERVNIIAHSMGGLDARYAISSLGLGSRVASLTTVGTPHHGTPLADLGASLLPPPLFGKRRGERNAIQDLTTRRMKKFSDAIPDVEGVTYGCVVVAAKRPNVHPLLVPGYLFLQQRAGDNDGVVPAASQRWGELRGEIEADHWGAVGWSGSFDAAGFYEGLVRDLGDRGL